MIIKNFPDKEKATSIFELAKHREEYVKSTDFSKFPTGKAENYYEIIKEFSSILLLLEGYKTMGENAHKEIFSFLLNRKIISEEESSIIQDLRIKRNYSMYDGKQINPAYLEAREIKINDIILKLKNLIKEKF